MKKLFYLAVVALLAMNVTLTSCSKDDDDEIATPDSLSETTWSVSAGGNSMTLYFINTFTYEVTLVGSIWEEAEGKFMGFYSYEKPDITLTLFGGEDKIELYGTVNGNKMTLIFEGDELILVRK
jgi:hypothetical protein